MKNFTKLILGLIFIIWIILFIPGLVMIHYPIVYSVGTVIIYNIVSFLMLFSIIVTYIHISRN